MTETDRGLRKILVTALVLAIFEGVVFLPFFLSGALLPASAKVVAPFARAGVELPVQDLSATDKMVFTAPNIAVWCDAVRGDPGRLLWNPGILSGYPFMATQDTFALYPLNVVFLIFGLVDGFLVSALLHGWVLSFGMALLLGRCSASLMGARVGGALAGACPWVLAHLDIVNFVQAAAWLPWIALGALLLLGVGGPRRPRTGFFLVSLGWALSLLGGMAQISTLGLLFVLATVLSALPLALRRLGVAATLRALAFTLLAGVTGLLLAGPQVLPLLEMAGRSERARLDDDELSRLALKPLELVELVFPEVSGHAPALDRLMRRESSPLPREVTEATFGPARAMGVGGPGTSFMERVFFPGVIGLFLIVFGLALSLRSRLALTGLGLVVFGTVFAAVLPHLGAIGELPVFRVGNPRRFLLLAAFGQVMLAVAGFDALGRSPRRAKRVGIAWISLYAAGVLVAVVFGAKVFMDHEALGPEATSAWLIEVSVRSLVFAALVLPLVVVPSLSKSSRRGPWILFLLAAELALFNQRVNPAMPSDALPQSTASIEALRAKTQDSERFVRYHPGGGLAPLPPNFGLLFGLNDIQGYEGLLDRRTEALAELIEPGMAVKHHLIRELRNPMSVTSPVLDRMAVSHVLSTAPLPLPFVRAFEDEGVGIFRRDTALPRLLFPNRLRIEADDAAVLRWMGSEAYDPKDHLVLTEADAAKLLGHEVVLGFRPLNREGSEIEIVAESATMLEVRYRGRGDPLVLLWADSYHPDWSGQLVDGTNLTLARVDHGFRGVALPESAEFTAVTFRFRPRAFRFGLCAAVLGLAFLLAAVLVRTRTPVSDLPERRAP